MCVLVTKQEQKNAVWLKAKNFNQQSFDEVTKKKHIHSCEIYSPT